MPRDLYTMQKKVQSDTDWHALILSRIQKWLKAILTHLGIEV